MSAHPLNKECANCVRHANDCNGRAACLRCFSESPMGAGLLGSAHDIGDAYEAWQAQADDAAPKDAK